MKQQQNTGPLRLKSLSTFSKGFLKTYLLASEMHQWTGEYFANFQTGFGKIPAKGPAYDNRRYSERFPLHLVLTLILLTSCILDSANSQDKHGEHLNFMYFEHTKRLQSLLPSDWAEKHKNFLAQIRSQNGLSSMAVLSNALLSSKAAKARANERFLCPHPPLLLLCEPNRKTAMLGLVTKIP